MGACNDLESVENKGVVAFEDGLFGAAAIRGFGAIPLR